MFAYAHKWKDRRMERKGDGKKKGRKHLNGMWIQEGFPQAPPDLQELMGWSRQWWCSRVSSLLAFITSPRFRVPVLPSSSSSSFT